MKKYLVIGIVVLVGIGAAVFLSGSKKANAPAGTGDALTKQGASEEKGTGVSESVVSSIKDALSLGKKMQCTYVGDGGDGQVVQSTVAIDGKRFRVSMSTPEGKTYVVSDGDMQYFWTEKEKTGFKMSQSCLNEVQKSLPENMRTDTNLGTAEDITKDFDTAKDVNCRPALSVDISVPSDVTFTDQCAMMKQSLDALKGIKLPEGVNIPSGN